MLLPAENASEGGSWQRFGRHSWYLRVFLEDGEVPLDNNATENSIQPVVVDRNWLLCKFFSDTPDGVELR